MKIRLIRQDDFLYLMDLWKKSDLKIASVDREKKEFYHMIQVNPRSCFVCTDNNKIIGSIFGAFNGRRGWIYHLCVEPEYRKKGYGTALLNKTVGVLKQLGATRVLLGVSVNNLKTAHFYQKNGFKVMNDAIHLQYDLYKDN